MSLSKLFRYYQEEANNAIYEELLVNNKCLVKMFCGTGKSLLMRKCKIIQGKQLVVYVFPSLSLIDQFYSDYLYDLPSENVLKVSSEPGATTEPTVINDFLSKPTNKIICVTYHSFNTLNDQLGERVINVCVFDEAHHAVGETYQKLIFENDVCEKQIFFTATPKNANGIVMYDRENLSANMCGKLVYDYSYLRGMNEGYLNATEIRIDMFLENTNKSLYESIARAVLSSGNSRVLTFHSDVNTERDTSVNNFVDDALFKRVFKEVHQREYPEIKKYKKVSMVGLTATISSKKRREILKIFDETLDDCVMVISSCETIGEGIDTKNANMCVFVDPKSSYVKIIQNFGRIVRKIFGEEKANSTILIPCWVDKTKYLECDGDREKCDEVIRQDMSETGNFNGIMNVLSALKQEDEDLYDICLYYPDVFSPQEIEYNLEKQGYMIDEVVGDGELIETMEYLLDDDIDYDDYETEEEMIMNIAEDNDVCVEIHSTSLENPVERYNTECESGEVIRLYYDSEEEVYRPIIEKERKTKRTGGSVTGPNRNNRMSMKVHTNPDVKVLWKITSDIDLTKDICSCVIDCEVVKYDPMEVATGIVERANERVVNGLRLLPRKIHNKKNRNTPELEQEYKDAIKLGSWKIALKGKGKSRCSDEVRNYLDANLEGWRTEIDFDEKAMEDAEGIVERANQRKSDKKNFLPRQIPNKENRTTPELEQERKDATKLGTWKTALKGKGNGSKCSDEVRNYLDANLEGWRTEIDFDEKAMEDAKGIVERANQRKSDKKNFLPRNITNKENRTTPELEQEYKDTTKLGNWKKALKGKGNGSKCSDKVRDYLDTNLEGWRAELDEKAMEDAKGIVERANQRKSDKKSFLPRRIRDKENRTTPELEQENTDGQRLGTWKQALKGKGSSKCPHEVRDYLDENLEGWRTEIDFDEKAMEDAKGIVERANQRKSDKKSFLPRRIRDKENRTRPELEQEHTDGQRLGMWKLALKGNPNWKCSDEVRDYLDENLEGWRTEIDFDEKAMEDAKGIVERANQRKSDKKNFLPRYIRDKENRTTPELKQEYKDSTKLGNWKQALKETGRGKCPHEVRDYLDANLEGWRTTDDDGSERQSVISSVEEEPTPKKSMKLKKPSIKKETPVQKRQRVHSELSQLHKVYKTLKSENLRIRFAESPELWHKYHEISEDNEKSFPELEIPRNRIIQELGKIQTKRTKLVVDMGCGKGQISQHFVSDPRFQFTNYDHVSSNETITTCDISQLPLEETSVEICILSLAMWGSNCHQYITEAHRVLESGCKLYIMEPTKRWSEQDANGNIVPGKEAIKLQTLLEESGFKIIEQSIAKFSLFICIKV